MKKLILKLSHALSKMYNWQCTKCTAQVNSENRPNSSGCPKGGSHNWNRLTN